MDQIKYNECVDRLNARNCGGDTEESLKIIYEWVKSSHINLPIFKKLIKRFK